MQQSLAGKTLLFSSGFLKLSLEAQDMQGSFNVALGVQESYFYDVNYCCSSGFIFDDKQGACFGSLKIGDCFNGHPTPSWFFLLHLAFWISFWETTLWHKVSKGKKGFVVGCRGRSLYNTFATQM